MGLALRTLVHYFLVWLLLIKSSAEGCSPDGNIRLSPDDDDVHNETYRLLQVCLFGHWSYVCGDLFFSTDQQLQDRNVVLNQLGCSDGDVQNFPSNSTPVYITNVNCRGVERKLLDCRHATLSNITDDCEEFSRVGVQVNCTKSTADLCQNGELMRIDTSNILYICVSNGWSVLCPRLWTPAQATVACRQLHPNKTVIRGNVTTVGKKTGDRFFTFHYYCTGEEKKLTDCHISGVDTKELGCLPTSNEPAVGIVCETATDDDSPVTNATSCSPLSWVGGGAIGAVLSAVILSTLFAIAFLLGRKSSQRKIRSDKSREADTNGLPHSDISVLQPLPYYEDCQPKPAAQATPAETGYSNVAAAVYDSVHDDDDINGTSRERNLVADNKVSHYSMCEEMQDDEMYSQLNRQ